MKSNTSKIIQNNLKNVVDNVNLCIESLGIAGNELIEVLNSLQNHFDTIKGVPSIDEKRIYELRQVRLNLIDCVEKIVEDYEKNVVNETSATVTGVGLGVASLGSTFAMGVTTAFGVVSTGTTISTSSGSVATKTVLAWLGGGCIVAGSSILVFAVPFSLAIPVVSFVGSRLLLAKQERVKEQLNSIFKSIIMRDIKYYELAILELDERTMRVYEETHSLREKVTQIKGFGLKYNMMTDEQQLQLGVAVNLMNSATQLLINPIMGLQPRYSENDFSVFIDSIPQDDDYMEVINLKYLIIYLANLLYMINLDADDKEILWNALIGNKRFLKMFKLNKEQLNINVMSVVASALYIKYKESFM